VKGCAVRRRQFQTGLILVAIVLLVAACGQADPVFAPADASDASPVRAATPTAAATPAASITVIATPTGTVTTIHPPTDWIDLPADFTVRTAEQAEGLAITAAQGMLEAPQPHVASTWLLTQREADRENGTVGGTNEDPLALIWWVNLDDAQYVIPKCPDLRSNGTPVGCGSSRLAAIEIVASNGTQPGLTVGRNFAPATGSGGNTLPLTAKLRTEGEAIAAALQYTPGHGTGVPQVMSVRLLNGQQWTDERDGVIVSPGMTPNLPLWEIELTNADIAVPCILTDSSACVHQHADVLFNALNGESWGVYSPPPASATATP
jgi:hypothetical protein